MSQGFKIDTHRISYREDGYREFWQREPDLILHQTDHAVPHIDTYRFPKMAGARVGDCVIYLTGGMSDAVQPGTEDYDEVGFCDMTRDAAFWTMVAGVLIPCLAVGWFRGRAVGKAYRAIYADLKNAGINLSKADLQLLVGQLNRNPKAVLETEHSLEARAIKQRHVESLLAFTKLYRLCFYILVAVGVIAVISFPHFWPKQ